MVEQPELEELAPLVGRAWTCGDRMTVAEILRRFASRTPRPHPTDDPAAATRAPGDFIVAGLECGIGVASDSALEHLKAAGIGAVIGRSFVPSFLRAAIDAGLPALVIEETAAVKPGDRLRVDLEQHKIANLSSGDRYIIRNLYDESLDILRAGGRAAYLAMRGSTSAEPCQ